MYRLPVLATVFLAASAASQSLRIESVDVAGHLEQDVVVLILARAGDGLASCVTKSGKPNESARLSMSVTPGGDARRVQSASRLTNVKCAAQILARLAFPVSPHGTQIEIGMKLHELEAPRYRVRVGNTKVDGSLNPWGVVLETRKRAKPLNDCYGKALRNDPEITGHMIVHYTVNTRGRMREVSVSNNKTGSQSLEQCIIDTIRSWKLKPPPSPAKVEQLLAFLVSTD